MIAKHYSKVPLERESNADKAGIRWLIAEKEGATTFSMRMIEVEAGGSSPYHSHPWEHQVYISEGEADVTMGEEQEHLETGYTAFVPPGVKHTFKNNGKETLRMICVIPLKE